MPTPTTVDIVRASLDAFARGDVDHWLGLHHPSAELVSLRNQVGGGEYRGHAGLREWWDDVHELWDEVRFDVRDIMRAGDAVLVIADAYARSRESGTELTQREVAVVARVEGGRITSLRQYFDVAEALDALGLLPDDPD